MFSDVDRLLQGLYAESSEATLEHEKGHVDVAMQLYTANIARASELAASAADINRHRFVEFLTIAYVRRGLSYRRTGETVLAIADLNQAIGIIQRAETKRSLIDVYFYHANALIAEGKPEQAKLSYQQFLNGKPQGEFGEGFGLQGDFSLWVPANVELSLADCNRAVEADAHFAEALFCRGLVRQHKGEWDAAYKDFQAAQRAAPDNLRLQELLPLQEKELDALQRQAQEKIRPTYSSDKARFRKDIDYCVVDIALDGQDYIFVHFYGVGGSRRESHEGEDYSLLLDNLTADGWQKMRSQSHQEGISYYFQRPRKV